MGEVARRAGGGLGRWSRFPHPAFGDTPQAWGEIGGLSSPGGGGVAEGDGGGNRLNVLVGPGVRGVIPAFHHPRQQADRDP